MNITQARALRHAGLMAMAAGLSGTNVGKRHVKTIVATKVKRRGGAKAKARAKRGGKL